MRSYARLISTGTSCNSSSSSIFSSAMSFSLVFASSSTTGGADGVDRRKMLARDFMVLLWDCDLVVRGMPGRGTASVSSSQATYIVETEPSLLIAQFLLELITPSLASIFQLPVTRLPRRTEFEVKVDQKNGSTWSCKSYLGGKFTVNGSAPIRAIVDRCRFRAERRGSTGRVNLTNHITGVLRGRKKSGFVRHAFGLRVGGISSPTWKLVRGGMRESLPPKTTRLPVDHT
jgi:hypothetical protein